MATFAINDCDSVDLDLRIPISGESAILSASRAYAGRVALVERDQDRVRFAGWWRGVQ